MLFSSGQDARLGKARGSWRPLNGDIMLYVLKQTASFFARLGPKAANLSFFLRPSPVLRNRADDILGMGIIMAIYRLPL